MAKCTTRRQQPRTQRSDEVVQKPVAAVHEGSIAPGIVPRELIPDGERLGDVRWRMHRGQVRCTEDHWRQLTEAGLRVAATVTPADRFVAKLTQHIRAGGGDPTPDYVMPDGYQLGPFPVRARRGEIKAMTEDHGAQVEALGISRRRQPGGPRR